ncbi:LysR family transcriptional regulator [Cupriavidus necator]|uniref:LysR family transcriptional regulator n=1 Tax=Cupriavidus necator TaxID=106590 RepID=UPI001925A12D|nr:LysR family transcriptional regulator [Cupriavidus necator]QQX86638.1 LysR family transcriptional regulator [Cupriavidus necator]
MDIDAVQLLLSVSKLGSFKAAAAHHRMTVSNVSNRIRKLESDFGAQVLRRTTRKLELTQLGYRLVSLGETIAEELAAAESELAKIAGQFGGTLDFWLGDGVLLPCLMPIVLDIAADNPRLRINVAVSDGKSPMQGDVGVEVVSRSASAGTPLSMVVCQAIRAVIEPEFDYPSKMSELPVCVLGHSVSPVLLDIFKDQQKTHVDVMPSFMTTDVEVLLRAVERGVGVGLLPKVVFDSAPSRDRFRVMLPDYHIELASHDIAVSVAERSRGKDVAVHAARMLEQRLQAGFPKGTS